MGLAAVGIWLAWQVIRALIVTTAPASIAVRVAPDSPVVLARAAEEEFRADDLEDAQWFAERALAKAPFNVPALRVLGLVEARRGDVDAANEILTLAGNWSLRDSDTHAWLIEQRLRQGDYSSAFAHADTLVRRRVELWPAVFNLFRTAALQDPRARVALVTYLQPSAPWRNQFLQSLNARPDTRALSITLAIMMKDRPSRFRDEELATLYSALLASTEYGGIAILRQSLVSSTAPLVTDGDFKGVAAQGPIGWTLGGGPGLTVEMVAAPGGRRGLHVISEGYRNLPAATQMVVLRGGRYRLTGRSYLVSGASDRLRWLVSCADSGRVLAETSAFSTAAEAWNPFAVEFQVPDAGCDTQWIRLETNPGGGRDSSDMWMEALAISPRAGPPSP
ncbi:MAG: hypothetical protein KJ916_05345 [Alphaproteobacteria bacterium]|nr:hypothetical protein [Alphaproteobacteria bacterium]